MLHFSRAHTRISSRTLLFLALSGLLLAACAINPREPGSSSPPRDATPEINESDSPSGVPQVTSNSLPFGSLDTKICKTQVSNAPDSIDNQITRASAAACVQGVPLMVNPAPGACLTSGFGRRNGRDHRGVDYQSKPAGNVVAAASGTVVTKTYRAGDFGNWIVIDHGSDVFTGYGHLASIDNNIREGQKVNRGQVLGVMGKTGPVWIRAIHLHYEVRTGNLAQARSFFNLQEIDPYDKPGSCSAS